MKTHIKVLGMAFVLFSGTLASAPAFADTTIGAQVLQSDLTLTKASSPYVVNGLIQIPAGKTLTIEPGAVVTFANGGGIKSLGDLKIGSTSSNERVTLNLRTNLDLVGNGLIPPSISIAKTDIYGQNSVLSYGCGTMKIDESLLDNFQVLVREQECPSMSIKNSVLTGVRNVYTGAFDGRPIYFVMQNNLVSSMQAICCAVPDRTLGNYTDAQALYNVSNNDFRNLETLNIPYGYTNYTLSNNNFTDVKNVKIVLYFGYTANAKTEVIASNYWGGLTSDTAIRSAIKVTDGKSDIAIQRTIAFEPVLSNPITLVGYPLAKAAADKAAADKAAADKAAADKAAADKAAADKAAAASKKTTINCVKGKIKKSVSGINPKCPSGFVKKGK